MTPAKTRIKTSHPIGSGSTVAVIVAAGLIVLVSMGLRQSFGIFMQPLGDALGVDRETFGLAIAVQNLLLGLPVAGYLADRFSPRATVIGGALIYAAAMALMAQADGSLAVLATLGVLTGIAQSATTFVVVLGAVARVVDPMRRATAFGVVTGLGSLGMFLVVPLSNHWLLSGGWSWAFEAMAWGALTMLAAAMFLPARSLEPHSAGVGFIPLLRAASGHRGYLLLIAGFFVCGFHVAFIATHLPAYAVDRGLSRDVAGYALALIGLFNIFGSLTFGWLADRHRKKYLLTWIYGLRVLVIGGFIMLPLSNLSALMFGAAIGLIWLATVPVTSGMVGQLFGARHLGTLYGVVFLGHQLGAFLGAWWAGAMFDQTGSYLLVWWTALLLSAAAALLHFFIDDRRVEIDLVPLARTP